MPGEPGSGSRSSKRDPPGDGVARLRPQRRRTDHVGGPHVREDPLALGLAEAKAHDRDGLPVSPLQRAFVGRGGPASDHVDERRAAGKLVVLEIEDADPAHELEVAVRGQQLLELERDRRRPGNEDRQALVLTRYLAGEPRQARQNASDVGSRAHQRRPASCPRAWIAWSTPTSASDVIMELPP